MQFRKMLNYRQVNFALFKEFAYGQDHFFTRKAVHSGPIKSTIFGLIHCIPSALIQGLIFSGLLYLILWPFIAVMPAFLPFYGIISALTYVWCYKDFMINRKLILEGN